MGGGVDVDDDALEPTVAEIRGFQRDQLFAPKDSQGPELYPGMRNLSAGFLYRAVVRPDVPEPAEYVTVPLAEGRQAEEVAIAKWNMAWEAGQFRRRFFDDDLPGRLGEVADQGDVNVVFVPRTRTRYYEHALLFHLLSRQTAERHGLPLLRPGLWPYTIGSSDPDAHLPADFGERLSRAWASTVWRHLVSGSGISAFSDGEPIRLLAHNLDFWLPAVTEATQDLLREFPLTDNGIVDGPVPLSDGSILDGARLGNPRKGGTIWSGEGEAQAMVADTVRAADADGRLRGILDAVKSHRVQDDFSDRWSFAKEDFERKLHRKRARIPVTFVELTETIPVQGPETEIIGSMVTADFLALLDTQDRRIVVLLSSGHTKLTDVANTLGYANHSAVSKRLARIRERAETYFGLD